MSKLAVIVYHDIIITKIIKIYFPVSKSDLPHFLPSTWEFAFRLSQMATDSTEGVPIVDCEHQQ